MFSPTGLLRSKTNDFMTVVAILRTPIVIGVVEAMDPNYFVCTLGQAAIVNGKIVKEEYSEANGLIDFLAEALPQRLAVGFPSVCEKHETNALVFSFSEIRKISIDLASTLQQLISSCSSGKPVALLCQSSPAFLFSWLALIRLGHPVLLVAPQLAASAISSLCKASDVSILLYDTVYENLAGSTSDWLRAKALPFTRKGENIDFRGLPTVPSSTSVPTPRVEDEAVAYLFHTSGTSSGLPKPIPQTHHAAVGVLPRLATSENAAPPATFTTTPLYHGGIADLFRSWTGGAMIWLFPAHLAPITAPNINKCLDETKIKIGSQTTPPVKYFSSVPYVLQLLAADREGLQNLQTMDLVGVGGAALSPSLGDSLVEQGVNLVSRYGSAECGFLLSSHRDYSNDKEWQYLRTASGAQPLDFEAQDDADETYELVVKPGWPHMAKRNRKDGSYATSDLFIKHKAIEGAWRYHSRKDAQLTLVTGKKFDPAPLEAALVTASPLIGEVVVFGDGEPYPGALIFRSGEASNMRDEEFMEETWKAVERMNQESQAHAKLARSMLVPMPSEASNEVEKSSKGTILRRQVEERFQRDIRKGYSNEDGGTSFVPDEKLRETILEMAQSTIREGEQLTQQTDLFSFGMDSAASIQIRSRLRRLLPKNAEELPLTVVEDCGNVNELSNLIIKKRHGESQPPGDNNDFDLMQKLVDRYSALESVLDLTNGNPQIDGSSDNGHVVVLTGATGALGTHVLAQLIASPHIAKIYCLVRGATSHAAHERISKGLVQRGLAPLSPASLENEKVVVTPAKLSASNLGLSTADYGHIAGSATLILHLAWSVNFRLRLASFEKESIASVTSLLRLALASPRSVPPAFVFCSSLASASSYSPSTSTSSASSPSSEPPMAVPEAIIDDPAAAAPLGYARSKWVAEHVCHRVAQTTRLCGRISVLRVGQLAGDTVRGVWNVKEAWPLMLSSVRDTQTLPALSGEVLDWLAVDIAAKAVIQAALGLEREGEDGERKEGDRKRAESEGEGEGMKVYHVLNENLTPTWMDMLDWLARKEKFEVVGPGEWVMRVEKLREEKPEHPAVGLLGLWRDAYGKEEGEKRVEKTEKKGMPTFAMEKSKAAAPILKNVKPVDKEYFGKLWEWIKTNM